MLICVAALDSWAAPSVTVTPEALPWPADGQSVRVCLYDVPASRLVAVTVPVANDEPPWGPRYQQQSTFSDGALEMCFDFPIGGAAFDLSPGRRSILATYQTDTGFANVPGGYLVIGSDDPQYAERPGIIPPRRPRGQ
jgi:hypothetical protein